ncbi:MAG TPA: hydrogenase maturation protease, partial [Thermodesulfatator atlanticus]|nr:hydrogenase maturation protease [Thermodesulfatator atlanticus]
MQRPRKLQNFEIAVVGLGNLLLGDEGFGVHFIRYLKTFHSLPPSVELIDGGCLGLRILDLFREKKALIVVDFLLAKSPPGTIKTLSWEEIK